VPRSNAWSYGVSRVELDHRSREAYLRLQRIERLLSPLVTVRYSLYHGPTAPRSSNPGHLSQSTPPNQGRFRSAPLSAVQVGKPSTLALCFDADALDWNNAHLGRGG
jgi:hypothetical protein